MASREERVRLSLALLKAGNASHRLQERAKEKYPFEFLSKP